MQAHDPISAHMGDSQHAHTPPQCHHQRRGHRIACRDPQAAPYLGFLGAGVALRADLESDLPIPTEIRIKVWVQLRVDNSCLPAQPFDPLKAKGS